MPNLIVMNSMTEQMSGSELNAAYKRAARAACRNTWLAGEGDILVSSAPIADEFLAYVGDVLGFDGRSLRVIAPPSAEVMTDRLLLSSAMFERIQAAVKRAPGPWTLNPCYYSSGVAELAERLGLTDAPGRAFAAEGGADLLNRKSHFRRLASGAGLPLAVGAVAHDLASFTRAVEKFLPETGIVIVKKDTGAGGMGNVAISRSATGPLAGVVRTQNAASEADFEKLWHELTDSSSSAVVVEAYHHAERMFYFEAEIGPSGHARFDHGGEIRLETFGDELVWRGLDLPCALPAAHFARAATEGQRFADLAASLGYRGLINIDAIYTLEGQLIFNEANGRWGGGSAPHTVAARLHGRDYANSHVVSSRFRIPSRSLRSSIERLRQMGLHHRPGQDEGVVILACDENLSEFMEVLILAPTLERSRAIEKRVLETAATS